MFALNVKADLRQIQAMANRHQRKTIPKVASRALNRAINAANTTAVRTISAATKLKQKDIRGRMRIRGASTSRLIATLEAFSLSPNLSRFRATQNKAGVAATAWEGRKTYKHAFVMPSGRVVTRTTSKRFPIKGLRGPSLPRTFIKDGIIKAITAAAEQRWRSEFERQLAREFSGSFQAV